MQVHPEPADRGKRDQNPSSRPREFPAVATKIPPLRVLVVDDEPLIRWSLSETLADCGCETVEAADGRSAIKAVLETASPFDVVLLDLRLPDSSDLGLLARLRGLAPASQVIVMTAFGTADVLEGALELGASHVVSKPFEVAEVASLVSAARRPPGH